MVVAGVVVISHIRAARRVNGRIGLDVNVFFSRSFALVLCVVRRSEPTTIFALGDVEFGFFVRAFDVDLDLSVLPDGFSVAR
jgi:hypothetical protein